MDVDINASMQHDQEQSEGSFIDHGVIYDVDAEQDNKDSQLLRQQQKFTGSDYRFLILFFYFTFTVTISSI